MSCLGGDWFCPLLTSPTVQACSFLKCSVLRHLCSKAFGMFGTPGLYHIWPPLEGTLLGVLFHPGTTARGHYRHPWLAGPRLKMKLPLLILLLKKRNEIYFMGLSFWKQKTQSHDVTVGSPSRKNVPFETSLVVQWLRCA